MGVRVESAMVVKAENQEEKKKTRQKSVVSLLSPRCRCERVREILSTRASWWRICVVPDATMEHATLFWIELRGERMRKAMRLGGRIRVENGRMRGENGGTFFLLSEILISAEPCGGLQIR